MKTMIALVAALALPSLALADGPMKTGDTAAKTAPKTAEKMADADVKLIAHVHHVNAMEMDMGKLAAAKATGGVRTYGQTLMKDHRDGDKDLVAFAKKKGVTTIPVDVPPTEADKKEHADMMAKMAELKKLKGAEFDRQFLMMMADGHDKEIAKLDAALPNIKDVDLASKMRDLRPVLQRHADTARDLQKNAPTASNDVKNTKIGATLKK
jgi:putative membrane protein